MPFSACLLVEVEQPFGIAHRADQRARQNASQVLQRVADVRHFPIDQAGHALGIIEEIAGPGIALHEHGRAIELGHAAAGPGQPEDRAVVRARQSRKDRRPQVEFRDDSLPDGPTGGQVVEREALQVDFVDFMKGLGERSFDGIAGGFGKRLVIGVAGQTFHRHRVQVGVIAECARRSCPTVQRCKHLVFPLQVERRLGGRPRIDLQEQALMVCAILQRQPAADPICPARNTLRLHDLAAADPLGPADQRSVFRLVGKDRDHRSVPLAKARYLSGCQVS